MENEKKGFWTGVLYSTMNDWKQNWYYEISDKRHKLEYLGIEFF